MSNANDLAFPIDTDRGLPRHPGLTKREYFAGMAMSGMLANTDERDAHLHYTGRFAPVMAENAVLFADALLAELERTK